MSRLCFLAPLTVLLALTAPAVAAPPVRTGNTSGYRPGNTSGYRGLHQRLPAATAAITAPETPSTIQATSADSTATAIRLSASASIPPATFTRLPPTSTRCWTPSTAPQARPPLPPAAPEPVRRRRCRPTAPPRWASTSRRTLRFGSTATRHSRRASCADVTPALPAAHDFQYDVRARWTEDGKPVDQTRSITVHANQRVEVDFTQPEPLRAPKLASPPK